MIPLSRLPARRLSFTGLLFRTLSRQSTPSFSRKMSDEDKIELMLEMISDLKLRNEKLESEAMMTHLDLTHMRHEIDELKQTLASFMDIMSRVRLLPSRLAHPPTPPPWRVAARLRRMLTQVRQSSRRLRRRLRRSLAPSSHRGGARMVTPVNSHTCPSRSLAASSHRAIAIRVMRVPSRIE